MKEYIQSVVICWPILVSGVGFSDAQQSAADALVDDVVSICLAAVSDPSLIDDLMSANGYSFKEKYSLPPSTVGRVFIDTGVASISVDEANDSGKLQRNCIFTHKLPLDEIHIIKFQTSLEADPRAKSVQGLGRVFKPPGHDGFVAEFVAPENQFLARISSSSIGIMAVMTTLQQIPTN